MKKEKFGFSSSNLHILAMALMLCDHLWATFFLQYEVMTCIGRLAFPIFAFMIAEGFYHTKDLKKYRRRMLLFALISEIPFNLIMGSDYLYPFHQNVLWTFLIALLCMTAIEKVKARGNAVLSIAASVGIAALGYLIGLITMVDYGGAGVLTVLLFYFFRERKPLNMVIQLAVMYYLHAVSIGGYYYDVNLFGRSLEITQQSFAILALIPIWLYNGKPGYQGKWFKWFNYWFYPGHLLLLYLAWHLLV